MLEFIGGLPADLQSSPLVIEQKALALSNSGDHDTAIGALRELINTQGDTSERRGLLGGRYRRKWNKTGSPLDLDRAIAEYDAGMKLDLNDYFPSSNLARLYRTRSRKGDQDKAVVAAAVAMTACERARNRNTNDEWLNPTLLGAAFDAGDAEKAQDLANLVMLDGPAAWKLDSTLGTCRIAAQLYEEPRRGELLAIISSLEAMLPGK